MPNQPILYHCPGFLAGCKVYRELLLFRAVHPEYFYEDCIVDTIFDSFPMMTWNGGGTHMDQPMLLRDIEKLLDYYAELNISLQLTATNPVLEKIDVYDRYCNAILERFLENPINSVLVASPILEDYIREKYPNAKIDWSIVGTSQPENINLDYNDYLDKYNRIVIPRVHGKDFEYLKKIDENKRHKIELLCTDPCPKDCPRIASHYREYGYAHLYLTSEMNYPCTGVDKNDLMNFEYIEDQILYEEFPKYLELGYNRFKLSGRRNAETVIHNVVKYFVKPEYQYEMVFYLLSRIGR